MPESVLALRIDGVRFVPVGEDVYINLTLAWHSTDQNPAIARLVEALKSNGFAPTIDSVTAPRGAADRRPD